MLGKRLMLFLGIDMCEEINNNNNGGGEEELLDDGL